MTAPCSAPALQPEDWDGPAVSLADVRVAGSQYGDFTVCRVAGVLAGRIGFVVELPLRTYQERYLQVGCGGLCGTTDSLLPQAAGCRPLLSGQFVVATNDLGHRGTDGAFGADPEARVDFAYRADHQVAGLAKALIEQAYGAPPRWSYFSGCSTGGREALGEVQRYPEDFDGVVAGAPALLTTQLFAFYESWVSLAVRDPGGAPLLGTEDLRLVHAAVLASCDGRDGLVDGLLADPTACDWDPGALVCADGAVAGCLTPDQVHAVRAVYTGPVDVQGRRLYPGGAERGSELAWSGWIVPEPPGTITGAESLAAPWLAHLASVPLGPGGVPAFDAATFDRARQLSGLYDAADPDLRRFRDAGGKLVLYHGWADPAIPPAGTVAYHRAVQDVLGGADATADVVRLFMVPGLGHCVDGSGPDSFDALSAVVRWVEDGVAPASITASDPTTGTTRPVYPYPAQARYDGHGDPAVASSFRPSVPAAAGPVRDVPRWRGSFRPGGQLWWDGRRLVGTAPRD
jgi:feruloyl esterase